MAKDSEIDLIIPKGIQTQNIFIPVSVFEQLITGLPISAELIHTLKFFKFSKLGDLHSIPYRKIARKFINVNLRSYNLIAELYTFLTSLQSTEISRLIGNENGFEKEEEFWGTPPEIEKTEIYNQEKAEESEIKYSPTAETVKNSNDDFGSFLDETIFIAPIVKQYSVSSLELSVRLENVLRKLNIEKLGDLHEISFRHIFHNKNCGRKSIFELRDLIEKIHQDEVLVVKFDGEYNPSDFSKTSERKISVPESVKEMLIRYFSFSNRLKNVLNNLAVSTLGGLEIYSLDEIRQTGSCGQKTFNELRELLAKFQDENFVEKLKDDYRRHLEKAEIANARQELIRRIEGALKKRLDTIIKNKEGKIFIPQSVKEITVKSFVFSGTVEKIFDYLEISTLADFEKYTFDEIKKTKRYSKKTIAELRNFIIRLQQVMGEDEMLYAAKQLTPDELNLNELLNFINKFLTELSDREREIVLERFGGKTNEKVLTLEELGERFNVTRERIRQMESEIVKNLKNLLTGISEQALEKLNDDCLAAICPLTERFLIHLTQNEFSLFEYAPNFYLRLLSELSPDIPIFINNQTYINQLPAKAVQTARQIKSLLDEQSELLPLAEVFNRLLNQNAVDDLTIKNFFEAIQARDFIIQSGDSAGVLLIDTDKSRLTITQIARQVLFHSERSLTPEEIVKRAREMFGSEIDMPSVHSIANLPGYEQDFYLLGKKTIGLRQHFQLPEEQWIDVRNDFYRLLSENKRPVSTTEAISKKLFDWTNQTTAAEATVILREDERFKDLGRFLFALSEWQIEEREPIKDLIVKVLREAKMPLTTTEIGNGIQKYRSASILALSTSLNNYEAIKKYNFGYYGLNEWDDDFREFFITNTNVLYRLVKRNKPVIFEDMCQEFGISYEDELANRLWRALRTTDNLSFDPVYKSPETKISRVF